MHASLWLLPCEQEPPSRCLPSFALSLPGPGASLSRPRCPTTPPALSTTSSTLVGGDAGNPTYCARLHAHGERRARPQPSPESSQQRAQSWQLAQCSAGRLDHISPTVCSCGCLLASRSPRLPPQQQVHGTHRGGQRALRLRQGGRTVMGHGARQRVAAHFIVGVLLSALCSSAGAGWLQGECWVSVACSVPVPS